MKKNDPKKNKNMCSFSWMIFSSYWTDFCYFSSPSGRTCQKLIFLKGGVHGFIYFSFIFFITFYFLTTHKWCMEITPKYTITIINTLSMLLKGSGGSMNYVVGLPNNSYKRITNTSWVGTRVCKLQKKGALDSQPQVITFTSCLPIVGDSLRVLRLLPPLELVAMR